MVPMNPMVPMMRVMAVPKMVRGVASTQTMPDVAGEAMYSSPAHHKADLRWDAASVLGVQAGLLRKEITHAAAFIAAPALSVVKLKRAKRRSYITNVATEPLSSVNSLKSLGLPVSVLLDHGSP